VSAGGAQKKAGRPAASSERSGWNLFKKLEKVEGNRLNAQLRSKIYAHFHLFHLFSAKSTPFAADFAYYYTPY
jgi:hypothetical protein